MAKKRRVKRLVGADLKVRDDNREARRLDKAVRARPFDGRPRLVKERDTFRVR